MPPLLKPNQPIDYHEVWQDYYERIATLRTVVDRLIETYSHESKQSFYDALIQELPPEYNYTLDEVSECIRVLTYRTRYVRKPN